MSPCRVVTMADGVKAFLCGHGAGEQRAPRCSVDGCRNPADYLCDWPAHNGGTCDARLCGEHAVQVADDRHVCPFHTARPWPPVAAVRPLPPLPLFAT